jgi:Family of unknown function (DUF6650)
VRFEEIIKRLTGIGTPVFGISWNPPESERSIADRIIAFLEDRRVLYNPSEMEIPDHCARSAIEIRQFLSSELGNIDSGSTLNQPLRAMRAACRKFLDTVSTDERILRFGSQPGHFASWEFNGAVGELRGVFGIHIAQLAAQYGHDVEDQLASILPEKDKD